MKEINLKEIIKYFTETFKDSTSEIIIASAMRYACEQTIQLCAENIIAETIQAKEYKADLHTNQINSILSTINQIK